MQYNGGFLPDMNYTVDPRLLYYLRGTHLNVMEEVLFLQPKKRYDMMIPPEGEGEVYLFRYQPHI